MTPEPEERARAALERMPVANYASYEVWLSLAVPLIAAEIRAAVAEEREDLENDFLKLADSCARSNAPLQENTWRRAAEIVRARAKATA